MAIPVTIRQGDTADWTLPLKDADSNPVNLDSLLGYAVFLFNNNGKIIHKYSNHTIQGFTDTLTPKDDPQYGNIRLICESSHTRQFIGEVFYEIKIQIENEDYENNRWTASTQRQLLMNVAASDAAQFTSIANPPES